MRQFLIGFMLLFTCSLLRGQVKQEKSTVKGIVRDDKLNVPLKNSSVNLLRAADSTLYLSVRADAEGHFVFNDPEAGNYILLVTYPHYADYVQPVKFGPDRPVVNLGQIGMLLKSRLLNEVVIKGSRAVTMKGDTIEYDARSFVIEPNSKVEDLLTQLPGIQVDQDGKITAQGKEVKKVLVDGEEFFSDDPTLVTRNLRGDMIEKVQVYDKKSGKAAFTGIEDGVRDKTINLKLREDSKKGYFGNAEAAEATNGFRHGNAIYNRFSKDMKMTVTGGISNYKSSVAGAGSGVVETSGNDISFNFTGQGEAQQMGGIPESAGGGLRISGKGVNADYLVNHVGNAGTGNRIVKNNLPSGVQNTASDQVFDSRRMVHSLKSNLSFTIDSTSQLTAYLNGNYSDVNNFNRFEGRTTDEADILLNRNSRVLDTKGTGKGLNGNILWMKRMRRPGRTVTARMNWNLSETVNRGTLYSETHFYKGQNDSTAVIDQYKRNTLNRRALGGAVSFTENLGKKLSLGLDYGIALDANASERLSFNQDGPQGLSLPDSAFSNRYRYSSLDNTIKGSLSRSLGQGSLSIGLAAKSTALKQKDLFRNSLFNRSFFQMEPGVSFTEAKGQKMIIILYQGSNVLPGISQLQPVTENIDPLYETRGNADLDPAYNHRFTLNYTAMQNMGKKSLSLSGSYSLTTNSIIPDVVTGADGKTVSSFVNLNDRAMSDYNFRLGRNITLRNSLRLGSDASVSGNTGYALTNGQENKTNYVNYALSLNVQQFRARKYTMQVTLSPSYTVSNSSLQPSLNNNGFVLNGTGLFTIHLPFKVQATNHFRYTFNQATQYFSNDFSRLIWNTILSKKFLKSESLMLRASMSDLLNQGNGFSRSANNNMIIQNNYNTVRRYVLFSLVYDFKKMGSAASE
ncbi:TonB-dependent receptor [Pararcticibacter amylolyticus]|uniref:Outer membrane protein beta-barrel domain-containing protein n=1 Tax=Pararcticibacter amylolyticus TaxID=2173175 RepID=A0A2U2PE28_9SPHI|nr:TonB-dependent receptor [Pararcticibacter amylolyticus]PWG79564.1 hypothetical protein DDR33_15970 [Pararcticibacter amylolyticus]